MKKKYTIFTLIIIILFVTTFLGFRVLKPNNVYKEENTKKPAKITKGISMNLEQTAGAGDYKTVTQSGWPTEGYKFNTELSRCENGSKLSWDDTKKVVVVSGNLSDKCYVYFDIWTPSIADYCTSGTDLATCVKNFGDQGANISNIYIHDSSLTNGAGDGSYRYAGSSDSVNNFVCFGSSASTCPTDNLYRIIGVFGSNNHGISNNLVKLIKYDYASKNLLGSDGNYYGSTTPPKSLYKGTLSSVDTYTWKNNSNAWSWSSLNKTNLNTNFLSNIGTTWADKIISVNWVTGGNTSAKVINTTAKNAYANEITSPASTLTAANKIGMMYVSDYGFAATPSAWSSNLNNYSLDNIRSTNWMYMGMQEWTNTRDSKDSDGVFYIHYSAYVEVGAGADYELEDGIGIAVRPCFYLVNGTKYLSGTGEKSSPIRIE